MRMDEMNEILERRGFNVSRRHDRFRKEYVFTIKKDDIFYEDVFVYPEASDYHMIDCLQRNFLDTLIRKYEEYAQYVRDDVSMTRDLLEKRLNVPRKIPDIKKVIFNPPATVVLWEDGTKTVVKAQDEDFDPEKGLAMAISKKALGNQGNYCNEIKKWTDKYLEERALIDGFMAWMEEHIYPKKPNPTQQAYDILVKTINKKGVLKSELGIAIEEAIGYLGEALDE